jgi:hypothetical protein
VTRIESGPGYEIRWDAPGDGRYPVTGVREKVDEVIAHDVTHFHLEAMNESQWWMTLTLSDGSELTINLGATNTSARGYCMAEWD